jgi:hypothetical protein
MIMGALEYKDDDSINLRLSYGYKTIFANIFEYERNNVSKANRDDVLAIELIIAQFSYALLPKLFQRIVGITGTL